MLVPVLVLILAALAVGTAGALAHVHRLPRNRVLGIRTAWTMSSVDAFRRANRVAAPAFLAAGGVGTVAGVAALLSPSPGTAVVLVVVGALAVLLFTALAGALGARFAVVDEAETRAVAAPAPCGGNPAMAPPADDGCADEAPGGCGSACSLCPRAGTGSAST